jgi:hypothetical protein
MSKILRDDFALQSHYGQRLLILNGTSLLCQHLVLDLTLGLGLYWGFPCRGCWFVFLMSNKLMSKLRFWGGLWAADWLLAAVLARADFLGGAAGHHLRHARLGYGQHSVHDELLLAVQKGAEATRTLHSINVVVIQSVSSSVAATGGATQTCPSRQKLARSICSTAHHRRSMYV